MIEIPFNATQVHMLQRGGRWEVSIHFAGPWLRTGVGGTAAQAMSDAMRRPPIAMGADAPMFCDAARLYGDDTDGAA